MASEQDDAESSGGKWAAEAFGLLRFYQRVGNQLWGLILMNIGWAALVLLIAKLLPDEGEKEVHHLRLIDVFLLGALVVTFCWVFSSGLYVYGRIVLERILRAIGLLLLLIWFVLILAIQLVFQLREYGRIEGELRREEEKAAERRKAGERKLTGEQPVATPTPAVAAERKKRAAAQQKKEHEQRVAKAFKLLDEKANRPDAPWPLRVAKVFDPLTAACIRGISWLNSSGRIGLAPIYTFTFEEDRNAVKAPMQAFASAVDRLQYRLQNLSAARRIRFDPLPAAVSVTTARRARLLRWIGGFDAVLWGSYTSTRPPRIAMQMEVARPQPKGDEDDWSRTWNDVDPFRTAAPANEGMIVNQDDWFDAYIAVAMTLVHAINARELRPTIGGAWGAKLDRIRLYSDAGLRAIITALVEDCLFAMPAGALSDGSEVPSPVDEFPDPIPARSRFSSAPTAKESLVSVAGKWLARQLDDFTSSDERCPDEFLEDVARRCAELCPEDAENHYRLATVLLATGKTNEARAAIAAGVAADSRLRRIGEIPFSVKASMALGELDILSREGSGVRVAKCGVHVARAIARGGQKTRGSLAEEYKKTTGYKLSQHRTEPRSPELAYVFELLGLNGQGQTGTAEGAANS